MERCVNYCGITCVNGYCPNALATEYPEYGYEHCTCEECGFYDGCQDCTFRNTPMCTPMDRKGQIMKIKEIEIKYVREDVTPVAQCAGGDWIDLRTAVDVAMNAGDFKIIPLGVAMKLPENYEALVVPRSSTFKRYGIIMTNSIGVIDEAYCGNNDEWGFPVYATRACYISKNTRICQFRIIEHQPLVQFKIVENLTGKDRGGFGSTGRR
jgi:dUTP pyrophosphatase